MSILKEIRQIQKKPDGIFGSFMTRPFSVFFVYIFIKLKITPNTVSFISFLFCLASCIILVFAKFYFMLIIAAILWWFGAIFDAADGDLARYTKNGSIFGEWFDSFLDRFKEFFIFGTSAYLAYKATNKDFYLILGMIAIFVNIMSAYITATKKQFVRERLVDIKISKNYCLMMVDTRDVLVIVAILFQFFNYLVLLYSTIFILGLLLQIFLFIKKFRGYKERKIIPSEKK